MCLALADPAKTVLARTAADLEKEISALVEDMAPGLVVAEAGLGALTAAQLLLSYSHHGRIRSEAAFGMLSGTALSRPPPAAPTVTASTG
jgi:transposase